MDVSVSDGSVPGTAGPIPIRHYEPSQPRGIGLLWIHGGGFAMGDLDMPEADAVSRAVAALGIAVVSTHYRLAGDGVVFPAPSDDVFTVWRWIVEHEPGGVPAGRWSIGGASAGANLAASVSLRARDQNEPLPHGVVLVYPGLHGRMVPPSDELAAKLDGLEEGNRITAEIHEELGLNYVGDPALFDHPYAFPGEGQLEGFPPTLIINSEYDSLRASGEKFGSQLAVAAVDCTVFRMVGAEHAFLNEPDLQSFTTGVSQIAHWLLECQLLGIVHDGPSETEET